MATPISNALAVGGVPATPQAQMARLQLVANQVLHNYETQQSQWNNARSLFASRGLDNPILQDIPGNLGINDALDTTAGKAAFLGGSPVNPGTSSLNNYMSDVGNALAAAGKQTALDTIAHNRNLSTEAGITNTQRLEDLKMYQPTSTPGAALSTYAKLLASPTKALNVLPYQQDQEAIDSRWLPPQFKQVNKTGQTVGYNNVVAGPTIPMKAEGGKLVPANPQQYQQAQANFETSVNEYNSHMMNNLRARQAAGLHGVLSTPLIVTAEHYSSAGGFGGPTMQLLHMRVTVPPALEQVLPAYLQAAHWNLTELGKIKMPQKTAEAIAAWRDQYMGVLENPVVDPNSAPPLSQVSPSAFDPGSGGY